MLPLYPKPFCIWEIKIALVIIQFYITVITVMLQYHQSYQFVQHDIVTESIILKVSFE